jgi:hypothetical protein
MITGLGGTPFDRADEELKRLARVAVDLDLDDAFRDGSAEEIFKRLADSTPVGSGSPSTTRASTPGSWSTPATGCTRTTGPGSTTPE